MARSLHDRALTAAGAYAPGQSAISPGADPARQDVACRIPVQAKTGEAGALYPIIVVRGIRKGSVSSVSSGGDGDRVPITRLADVPLPTGGHALIEANLLGWGLVGCQAGNINFKLAHWEAAALAGAPDGPGLRHLTVELGGTVVGGGWMEHRPDGTGRTYFDVGDDDRRRAHKVTVDLAREPGSERLRQIISALPPKQARWRPPHNALAAGSLVGSLAQARRPSLSALERLPRRLGPAPKDFVAGAASISSEIFALKTRLRHEWAITAPDAAALLLAAQVPLACGQIYGKNSEAAWRIYCKYLTAAIGHISRAPELAAEKMIAQVARDGCYKALDAVASVYYSTAVEFRDAALDGPADPLRFAWQLYSVGPYAYAVMLICHAARSTLRRNSSKSERWARTQTGAAELFLRAGDGICFQYMDFCLGRIGQEREKVAAAQARGDHRAVWKLIRDGEFGLRWPRSYRPYLMGQARLPAVKPPVEGEMS
jgi:hypothetical protein